MLKLFMNKWMKWWMNGMTDWMNEWLIEWVNKLTNEQMNKCSFWVNEWINEWMYVYNYKWPANNPDPNFCWFLQLTSCIVMHRTTWGTSSHQGCDKWVPPIVAAFQTQPFSTSLVMGERVFLLRQVETVPSRMPKWGCSKDAFYIFFAYLLYFSRIFKLVQVQIDVIIIAYDAFLSHDFNKVDF